MIERIIAVHLILVLFILVSCTHKSEEDNFSVDSARTDTLTVFIPVFVPEDTVSRKAIFTKSFLYDTHTLNDTYPYRKGMREFQWKKIKSYLSLLDSLQAISSGWAILQNYKNRNGEAPLTKVFLRNEYKRIADTSGVERYQSAPLYAVGDTVTPVRYGRDGSLVKKLGQEGRFTKIETLRFDGLWLVPQNYADLLPDTVMFSKVIFVDVTNQNLASLESVNGKWLIRSMNPVTTGRHNPPYMQETPLGIYVVQEHKMKMIYLKDGVDEHGGFAPYASRFTNGGYIHGIPVNEPQTELVEFSSSLGTTPRSHMCVRTATSHAQFIYDWAVPRQSLVVVID